jgi:hypothetical protein
MHDEFRNGSANIGRRPHDHDDRHDNDVDPANRHSHRACRSVNAALHACHHDDRGVNDVVGCFRRDHAGRMLIRLG